MCRLLAYYGEDALLSHTIINPERSIIKQSYDARERLRDDSLPAHLGFGNLNADGFGIGFYSSTERNVSACGPTPELEKPCTFKSITPAWNNDNLLNLSKKCYSPLVFAHVRAAYPGMPVSEQNCHPFVYNRYMFMHNGIIAGFASIKRKLLHGLSDAAYDSVQSFHSDSAVSFALFLSHLPNLTEPHNPDVLLQALQQTMELIGTVQRQAGITDTSLLNFVLTDGSTLIATRCVCPKAERAASMYYAEGTSFRRADGVCKKGPGPYSLDYANKSARVILVASEPITSSASEWVAVPINHGLVVTRCPEGWMNVLHVPLSVEAPSPRMDTVVRCLRALPFDSTDATAGAVKQGQSSLLTQAFNSGTASPSQPHAPTAGAPTQECSSERVPSPPSGMAPRSNTTSATACMSSNTACRQMEYPSRCSPVSFEPAHLRRPPPHGRHIPQSSWDQSNLQNSGVLNSSYLDDMQVAGTPPSRPPFVPEGSAVLHDSSHRENCTWDSGMNSYSLHPQLLTGHTDAVLSLCLDDNGRLYSSSTDKTIRVWDMQQMQCVQTLEGHTKAVLRLQQQSNYLFSVGGPSIRIWCLESGKCVTRILTSRQAGWIRAMSVTPELEMVVGCQDTTLKVYECNKDDLRSCELDGDNSVPIDSSKAQLPSASQLPLASHEDNSSPLKKVTQSAAAAASGVNEEDGFKAPETEIGELAAGSPSRGTGLVTYDKPTSTDRRQITTPALQGNLDDGHCAAIHAVVCSQKYVCTAGGDCSIRVWTRSDLKPLSTMIGHRGPVFALGLVGDLLLSGGRDATIRVWDLDVKCCRRTLPGHTADVLHLAVLSPKRPRNPAPNPAPPELPVDSMPFALVDTPAPEGSAVDMLPCVLVSCSADGTCRLWDVRTWTCVKVITPMPAPPASSTAGSNAPCRTTGQADIVQPVLCSAITATHLALGMPSGVLHVYEIADLLEQVLQQQAQTVGKFSKSWQQGDKGEFVDLKEAKSEHAISGNVMINFVRFPVDASSIHRNMHYSLRTLAGDMVDSNSASQDPTNNVVTWRRPFQDKENAALRIESQMIRCLSHFVSIRTVSGDPQLNEEVFRGAKFLAGLLESVGMQVKLAQNVHTVHPCVLARLEVCPSRPTLVFYGHYDVQPAQELAWTTNPFIMTQKDGYLHGRGTSDNKGPILAMLFAVKELLDRREGEACAGLPCNLSFIFEGEEEIGSPGLKSVMESHLSWFPDPRLIVISNSQWIGDEIPCLTYGMRGMLCATVRVDGGDRNLHSGNDGGVFNEPMTDLVRLMSTLLDSQHHILVPGFYDGVDKQLLSPALNGIQENNNSVDFDVSGYAASLGVPALTCGSTLEEVLTSRWCLPSLTLADIRSSTTDDYAKRFGPTRFSVVPHFAQGNLSIRYVPNQSADTLLSHLTRHLKHEFQKLRSSNSLEVEVTARGQWWTADPASKLFQNVTDAIQQEWDCKPLPVREGGTMPCASMLENLLGAPAVLLPMGQNSDNCHLANEKLRKMNLIKGKNVIRRIIEGFGQPFEE